MKMPAFQFYPGDWLRDGVSGCSLAAQGLWLRLMILMHDSERYGYLCNNGLPIPSAQLARRCGCGLVEFEELIAELESAGVPSRSKDGIIYSRRMTRDAELRAQNAERQRKHYEDKKQKPNTQPNGQPNANLTQTSQQPNANLTTPLQSSSSSSKKKDLGATAQPKKPPDERSKHPAILAVREILGTYPNKLAYDEIIKALGEKPDLEKLQKCAVAWAGVTKNQHNFTWIYEWYVDGIPERNGKARSAYLSQAEINKGGTGRPVL